MQNSVLTLKIGQVKFNKIELIKAKYETLTVGVKSKFAQHSENSKRIILFIYLLLTVTAIQSAVDAQ